MGELFQHGLITFGQRGLEFVAGSPKTSAPEQVPHELKRAEHSHLVGTIDCHGVPSTSTVISSVEARVTVEYSA